MKHVDVFKINGDGGLGQSLHECKRLKGIKLCKRVLVKKRKKNFEGSIQVMFECNVKDTYIAFLSPLLFIIVLEALSREFREDLPMELLYADDLVLMAESEKLRKWKKGMGFRAWREVLRHGRLRWFGHAECNSGDDWVLACRNVVVAGVRCAGRGRKTWRECVKDDMEELGLHSVWVVFRDMWRGLISGKTLDTSWAWKEWTF